VCAKPARGYDFNLISERISKLRKKNELGSISYGFWPDDLTALLTSSLDFDPDIPDIIIWSIAQNGLFSAGRKGNITAKSLIREISNAERKYSMKKQKIYDVIASILIPGEKSPLRRRMGESRISFLQRIPKSHAKHREELCARYEIESALPRKQSVCAIRIKARSEFEAMEKGISLIDNLRGIWNLAINRRKPRRLSTGRYKQVNKIILGPLCTLHYPNGKPATSSISYDHYIIDEKRGFPYKFDWEMIVEFEKKARKRMSRFKESAEIWNWIRLYCKALDETDPNKSFQKLWAVLECITGTIRNNYDKTVKRASFLYEESSQHKQILNHLRNCRNKSIHQGKAYLKCENLVYNLKEYVERLLSFEIWFAYKFNSLEDLWLFLDSPSGTSDIDKMVKLLEAARRFRSGKGLKKI
jgi:hypothetical protein